MWQPFCEATPYINKHLLLEWKTGFVRYLTARLQIMKECAWTELKNGDQVVILLSDSQDQYAGILKDWFKTVVVRNRDRR